MFNFELFKTSVEEIAPISSFDLEVRELIEICSKENFKINFDNLSKFNSRHFNEARRLISLYDKQKHDSLNDMCSCEFVYDILSSKNLIADDEEEIY